MKSRVCMSTILDSKVKPLNFKIAYNCTKATKRRRFTVSVKARKKLLG